MRFTKTTGAVRLLLICLASMVAPQAGHGQERGEIGIAVGASPELVVVEDLDGNEVALADIVGGSPAVIEFWASWCENCEALEPAMEAAYEQYGQDVKFVAIAVAVAQSTRRVRRHLEDHPMPFPMLWDDGGRAVRAFLAPATSYVVALNAQGVVTYTGIGPEQDIAAAARSAIDD